ncbi:hypothetical protein V6N13_080668 [Hibiscus sabdariffa]
MFVRLNSWRWKYEVLIFLFRNKFLLINLSYVPRILCEIYKKLEKHRGHAKLTFQSGHVNNVFQAKFMPCSDDRTMVTCAVDGQIKPKPRGWMYQLSTPQDLMLHLFSLQRGDSSQGRNAENSPSTANWELLQLILTFNALLRMKAGMPPVWRTCSVEWIMHSCHGKPIAML